MDLSRIRAAIARLLAPLGTPARVVVAIVACLVLGVILFWLFNQVFYYYLTKSYVDELADAYDVPHGFATALLWVSFAAVAGLFGWTFSFNKKKRYAGYAGLLALVVAHSVAIGMANRNFKGSGQADRCYVLTRDSVKILNRAGIDPETGRECRPLTPVMAEKIDLYKTGRRPTRIVSGTPSFFSEISGEPVVWYAKGKADTIEMFDLMGYHPQTGEELRPVTRDVVEAWRAQVDRKIVRAPKRIDPGDFFDPVTGEARVWYWRNDTGQYEFYDGPGFQPRNGDPLQMITRDAIADWRKGVEAAAAKKKAEDDRIAKEAADRAEQERRQAKERAEQEQQQAQARAEAARQAREAEDRARDAELAETRQKKQFGDDCDRLATNPTDSRRAAEGVPFDQLKAVAPQAFEACSHAVESFPNEPRYLYQLARASQFKDKKRAYDLFTSLVALKYPAAFDNLGGMYLEKKDVAGAIALFTQGASLSDADSMVSLADLVDKGFYGQQNPYGTKWNLLNKAAQLNHGGAMRAVAAEKAKAENAEIESENQRETARRAGEIFGTILGGMVSR